MSSLEYLEVYLILFFTHSRSIIYCNYMRLVATKTHHGLPAVIAYSLSIIH